MDYFYLVRYSQDVKDFLVKLHQEGRSLKSLAEGFGPSNDSMDIWVKQATPILIKGQSKTLKYVKELEKRLTILEEENEILSRIA
ncbi:transposase [Leuconostoc suionicum]|uniref:transposase n=1 Tax=Leuconostoc suionicum TaxID=1511761 RepID=UPI0024ADE0B0|nr:transposase [Leuconostoc suionicum]MDI6682139.1 transposase [Leuconostoc suionicum]MDV7704582.1 transposase [Leuconostoc suionicum]